MIKRMILLALLISIPVTACADWIDQWGVRHYEMNYGNPVGNAIDSYTKLREINRRQEEFEHRKEMDEADQAIREQNARTRQERAAQDLRESEVKLATEKLGILKTLLETQAITQEAYDEAKKKIVDAL
jgi:predicted ribosome quality control (RQC) complex YloA/Tae2 family protein